MGECWYCREFVAHLFTDPMFPDDDIKTVCAECGIARKFRRSIYNEYLRRNCAQEG
jgi:hypothetical protein